MGRVIPRPIKALTVGLMGILAAASLVAGTAVTLARTSWGGERIRQFALPRLNASLAGRIDVGAFRFAGDRITVDRLTLRDPKGDVVAGIARVEVRFSPLALLRGQLRLHDVILSAPHLSLRRDQDGVTNLTRALAARAPSAPGGTDTQGDLSVELGALAIRGGILDLWDERDATATAFQHVRIIDINGDGAGRYGADLFDVVARLNARATMALPLQTPVSVVLNVHSSHAALDLWMGDNNMRVRGDIATPAAGPESTTPLARFKASVDIERIRIAPSLIELLSTDAVVLAPVTISGRASWDDATKQATTQLTLAAANATATITAAANLGRQSLDSLSVRARGVDLSRLIRDGPASDLSVDLDAHGQGQTLATMRGAATLHVPLGRLGGSAIGPIDLGVKTERGNYKVMDLRAVVPGARISGDGDITTDTVAVQLTVDLRDLGASVSSATSKLRPGSPRASGRGRIKIALGGHPLAPSLHLDGRLRALTLGKLHVPTVRISAYVPNLRAPLASRIRIDVPEGDIDGRVYKGVVVAIDAAGPRIDVRASLTAPEPLRLSADGVWTRPDNRLRFDRLTVTTRQGAWNLTGPTHVAFSDDVLRVDRLDLRGEDGQRLLVDLRRTVGALRADVTVSQLDLARLPPSLLPQHLKLQGRLTARINVQTNGTRSADGSRTTAYVTLTGGRVGNLRDIGLTMDTRLVDRRVSGQLTLNMSGATVGGTFDLPVAWPPPSLAPVRATFDVSQVDLRQLSTAIEHVRQVLTPGRSAVVVAPHLNARGTASVHVQVSGTGASPHLQMDAAIRQLAHGRAAIGDVTMVLDANRAKPITGRIELRQIAADRPPDGQPGSLFVRSGFSLEALLRHPPTVAQVRAARVEIEAHLDRVNLAPWAALIRPSSRLTGTASMDLTLEGIPKALVGKADLTIAGVRAAGFPATDGTLHVDLGTRDVRADVRITRHGTTLFSLAGRVDAPAARFENIAALIDVPIEIHARLGPLALQGVNFPPRSDRDPARLLMGRVRAQADLTGTLRVPRLTARADAVDLRLDKTPLGKGTILVSYADRKATGEITLASANGGHLRLVANTQADLGYPALSRGLDPRRLPVLAHLDATAFDVSGLSGIATGVRTVAGQLFASLDITGTAADPTLAGRFEWKDGGLAITGMGEYKRIHLLAHGDKHRIVLDELRADGGTGRMRVTAQGDHRAGRGYAIQARLALDDFPAYVEGQALAAISLRASADAHISVQQVRAKAVISSARVALSDAKRKHLQKMARPADVVLTEGGTPVNAVQARKLAAVTAALMPRTPTTNPTFPARQLVAAKATTTTTTPRDGAHAAGVVLLVEAPRNLWVVGKDANVELGLDPGFRVEVADSARAYGRLTVKRGRVNVAGRRFALKADSSVRFVGPTDTPELAISATHVNEQENIAVLVTVTGSPDHLRIGISAPNRPDLTETQLYTLIVTGRLNLGGGSAGSSTPTDRAASLLGGLVATRLQKGLAKKLPLDVLSIEAGNGLAAARLEAGTYVTADVYVGYVARLGADPARLQNRNAVHLEYVLGSRWSFQGEYGDAKTGSADVVWTNRY